MEKFKHQAEHTFYLYGDTPSDAEVYATGMQQDGCVLVEIRDGTRKFSACLPGYYPLNTEDFSDDECAAYRVYLAEHERSICHFALDRYFESSEQVTLTLDDGALQILSNGCRQFIDSPQRYFMRLLLWQLQRQENVTDIAQTLNNMPIRIEVKRNESGGLEASASVTELRM